MRHWTSEERQVAMLAILDTLGKEEAQNAQVLIAKMLADYVFCSRGAAHKELKRVLTRRAAQIQERLSSIDKEKDALRVALVAQYATAKELRDLKADDVFADPDPDVVA